MQKRLNVPQLMEGGQSIRHLPTMGLCDAPGGCYYEVITFQGQCRKIKDQQEIESKLLALLQRYYPW